jgi:hypothetical protein
MPTTPRAWRTWCAPADTRGTGSRGRDAMLLKALIGARSQLLAVSRKLENQIQSHRAQRIGRTVQQERPRLARRRARDCGDHPAAPGRVWQTARTRCTVLDRRIVAAARPNVDCRLFMTMPAIGPGPRPHTPPPWRRRTPSGTSAPSAPGSGSRHDGSSWESRLRGPHLQTRRRSSARTPL